MLHEESNSESLAPYTLIILFKEKCVSYIEHNMLITHR